MKFTKAVVLSLTVGSATAFAPLSVPTPNQRLAVRLHQSAVADEDTTTKKEDRLRMMKSDQFHRRGFKEVREGAEQRLESEYNSDLVKELKKSEFVMERDGVKVYLAKVSGRRD